jgi:hypothetical protein
MSRWEELRAEIEALPMMQDGTIETISGRTREAFTPADYVELYRAAVLATLDTEQAARAPEGEPEPDPPWWTGDHNSTTPTIGVRRAARAEPGLAEALEAAIAFGHTLANGGLGHSGDFRNGRESWRDCPQSLCKRIRVALEAHGEPQEGER